MNPMVDGWMGDDWFHNGAFRQQNMAYIHDQRADRKSEIKWWTSHHDDFDMFMQRIYHAPGQASLIELPLVVTP